MKPKTKFAVIVLLFLAGVFWVYHFSGSKSSVSFDFGKTQNNPELEKIINANLSGKKGKFAVVVEELPASLSAQTSSGVSSGSPEVSLHPRKYVLNEKEFFPSASLYKLILLAAALQEIEAERLKPEDIIIGSKSNLTEKLGKLDFGYEDLPEKLEFSVEEIFERIGRISDNFAAIMLTEKLRKLSAVDPLLSIAKELGMEKTSFNDFPNTTAEDVALFFRKLYKGEVVSKSASEKIMEILELSKINDRLPANLPEGVKVVHKTGELPYLRHDAGLVFPSNFPRSPYHPYLIVLLSKDLEFEDEGVETLAKISQGVYDYFNKEDSH